MTAGPGSIAAGQIIAGKFRVERVVGEGAMGVVLAALHLKLDQRVAIKILRGSCDHASSFDRFAREARAVARIESEHVARVLDVGALDDDTPYLVLEYLDGKDLAATLRDGGPFPIARAVDCILEACEALAEAHANGIIHRDVKPSNLFLAKRSDGTSIVKVLDFGISKWTRDGEELTASTDVVGSPAYMAPEQLRDARSVDARSDIWSIGVTLFELCSGVLPYAQTSIQAICAAIIDGEPRRLREVLPNAPAELDAVIARCLVRVPAKRFERVGDLAAALAPFGSPAAARSLERIARWTKPVEDVRSTLKLDAEAIAPSAPPPSNDPRATKTTWHRERPMSQGPPRAMIAVVALFAIAAGALALAIALQGPRPRPAASAPASVVVAPAIPIATEAPSAKEITIDLDEPPPTASASASASASPVHHPSGRPAHSSAVKPRDPFGDRE